jgi:uncharacterized RmlC-like cupin family protein
MAELNQQPPVQHAGWMIGEEHQTLFHFSPVPQLTTVVSYELTMHMYLFTFQGATKCLTHIHSNHLHSLYVLTYDT